jgi:hypothetical protein
MIKPFILLAVCLLLTVQAAAAAVIDVVHFGDASSAQAHRLVAYHSDVIPDAALGQSARRLLPLDPPGDYGGNLTFDLKVDADRPSYFTLKLWGGDAGEVRGRLILFCDGKQVGLRHLGDVDASIDILSDAPRFPGRFTYTTAVLPKTMTAGKQSVHIEVRALGRIWPYGDTWERFQKKHEQPSRGIYAAYTHTDAFFIPPSEEKQGRAPVNPPTRVEPGAEVLEEIKQRVSKEITKIFASARLNQMQMQLLAKAYHVQWTPAHRNEQAIRKVVEAMDALYGAHLKDPKLKQWDKETPNPDWFGFGPSGDALRRLAPQIKPHLTEARRKNWSDMLVESRDWHRANRRLYTNQSMIKDLYGIYLANRGIAVLDPSRAMPEAEVKRYLYESVGLQPWLGSDTPSGPAKPVGDNYMQLTAKGLTKELGYVGSYGEVLDWMSAIYDATRPAVGEAGDEKIKQQLIKAARARAAFRYPLLDADGFRTMVLEQTVGWRDHHYPGYVTYAQRPTRDAGPFETAAATLDPHLVGYAQQLISDNQFFASMREVMKEASFRVTAGLIDTPEHYELIKSQPSSPHRLPMTPSQGDFVFADEEDGVVAIKRGDDILYASLYWRARFGVNSLARVHFITPTIERDATAWQEVKFDDSGLTYKRDDRVMEAQSRRHEKSRGDVKQAFEGEVLPIAKLPPGVKFKPGDENIYAGKGTFYTLRYGPYLIAMNCTTDRTFDLAVPQEMAGAKELVSGRAVASTANLKVAPRSTMVLWHGDTK